MADLLFDRPASPSGEMLFGDGPPADQPYVPTGVLLFQQPATTRLDLLFAGLPGDSTASGPDVRISVQGALPALFGAVRAYQSSPVAISAQLSALGGVLAARYVSGAARPLASKTRSSWQPGRAVEGGAATTFQRATARPATTVSRWQRGAPMWSAADAHFQNAERRGQPNSPRWQDAERAPPAVATARWQDADRLRNAIRTRGQDADRAPAFSVSMRWQDTNHLRRAAHARWQNARRLSTRHIEPMHEGRALRRAWRSRYQDAMRPPAGQWRPTAQPPLFDPCYLPTGELLFTLPWAASGALLFICERHRGPVQPGATVVVPILEVYYVINNATLRRVDGNLWLEPDSLTLRLDVSSWTWGWSASLHGSALPALEPANYGEPVELEATINGTPFRLLAESLSRERVFGRNMISVSGRGKNAVLDAPYAPVRNFANTQARTAQQLANDVLTINGVNNGWDVDWQPEDWLVPANVFAHQGTHISALNAIAGALGGYLQPHRVDATLRILARYPTAPWDWSAAVPDFELPSAVTARESIEWTDKPRYNRVFASGVGAGVIGQVTRTGTAGDLIAPMVTDPLITAEAAARQRGLSVLADVGRQASVGLRLPVLAETGIIVPGQMVRYTDAGLNRIGMVRGVQVDSKFADLWQTLTVETHVDA